MIARDTIILGRIVYAALWVVALVAFGAAVGAL